MQRTCLESLRRAVQRVAVATCCEHIQVLDVRASLTHSPPDLAIVPDKNEGQAGIGGADGFVSMSEAGQCQTEQTTVTAVGAANQRRTERNVVREPVMGGGHRTSGTPNA